MRTQAGLESMTVSHPTMVFMASQAILSRVYLEGYFLDSVLMATLLSTAFANLRKTPSPH